jgi:membrane protein DedA with SNARE-associated domain
LDEAGAPIVEHREPRKGHLALLITPIAVMVAMGYVADALWPTLVEEHPLWLLGLSARNRYAVLVVNRVDLWAYYLLGTFRLLLPDPFFFALGWMYGPAALRWMEQRTPTVGSQMRRLEGYFGTWGYPLVVVIPNNYVCLIAGAARMSIPVFAALNVVGTVGRLLMLQVVGDLLRSVRHPAGVDLRLPDPAPGRLRGRRGSDGRRRAPTRAQRDRGPPGARAGRRARARRHPRRARRRAARSCGRWW